MLINIDNLKLEINKLNNLINNYEINLLNFYNEISCASVYWQDNNFDILKKNIDIEILNFKDTIAEFYDVKNIYDEIIKNYEKIGCKLEINLHVMNNIMLNFEKYLYLIRKLIGEYEGINFEQLDKEKKLLLMQLEKLKNIEVSANDLMKKLTNYYNTIIDFENKIKLNLSKIQIGILKENDISRYI